MPGLKGGRRAAGGRSSASSHISAAAPRLGLLPRGATTAGASWTKSSSDQTGGRCLARRRYAAEAYAGSSSKSADDGSQILDLFARQFHQERTGHGQLAARRGSRGTGPG